MRVALLPDLSFCLNNYKGRSRRLITHEVNPRFLSSFFKSATVSWSQLLERRTVETKERFCVPVALHRGRAAGRRTGNMLKTRVKPGGGGCDDT